MKPKKRQKLCQNCEGDVDLDVIVCPYCAADLREEKPEQTASFSQPMSIPSQATSQSLYPPAYPREVEDSSEEEAIEPSEKVAEEKEERSVIAPVIFFTLGVQLLLLGLLILLFSHKGAIILKWEAKFWFLYIFASLPFLIFGYRALSKI